MPTLTTRYCGDMLFENQLGNHRILIDVPPAMGGKDRGPTPPEIFIASLGACIGAFVSSYCRQASIDAEGMTVDISFDKVANPTRLSNLRATIRLPHDTCHGREEALRRVTQQCIIHETMAHFEGLTIEIVTEQPQPDESVTV